MTSLRPSSSAAIRSFTKLAAWQQGHQLVLMIYKTIAILPPEEKYGLADQLRRAAISITSNIAEGFSLKTVKDKRKSYRIALGSLTEIQNQLLAARDLHYINQEQFQVLAKQSVYVSKLLNGLIKSAPPAHT